MKPPVLPILAVAAFTWACYNVVQSQTPRIVTEPPITPPRAAFAQTIAAVGLVEPSSEAISIGSPRSGVVDQVFVKVGDVVKKDQPLLKLRTRELEAEHAVNVATLAQAESQVSVAKQQVEVARAQVKIAEAELAQSQRMLTFADSVKDSRVLSDEERAQRALTVATHDAKLQSAKANVSAAESNVAAALSTVEAARAKVNVTAVDIDRSTIKAPSDATVLQAKVRAGEYVLNGSSSPWLTIGQTQPLHVRADVDEHEAWKVKPTARAEAQVRGNPSLKTKLTFVRFEPLVIPKKSLTGDATERVDTRVLQIIYRIDDAAQVPLFVGQQMDVFIDDATAVASK
jgi:multidrug resistance efflux pump